MEPSSSITAWAVVSRSLTRFEFLGQSCREHGPNIRSLVRTSSGLSSSVDLYLRDVERQDKPLADRRREAGVGLDEALGRLSQVADVEHVVQVSVPIGDQVKHHVVVLLVRVDVMEDHQGVAVETGRNHLPCLSVDEVKQGLKERRGMRVTTDSSRATSIFTLSTGGRHTYDVVAVEFQAAPPVDAPEVGGGQSDDVQLQRLLHKHDVVVSHAEAVEVTREQSGAKRERADLLDLPQSRLLVLI